MARKLTLKERIDLIGSLPESIRWTYADEWMRETITLLNGALDILPVNQRANLEQGLSLLREFHGRIKLRRERQEKALDQKGRQSD